MPNTTATLRDTRRLGGEEQLPSSRGSHAAAGERGSSPCCGEKCRCSAKGSPKNNFAVRPAAPPTDLVSVEEVIVHYDAVIVELYPAELVSVEA